MTISSSLNAGVAGLKVNATRLAAISDNIANSSTYGYKRVEADFQSHVVSGSGGSYSAGGVSARTRRLIDGHGSLVTTSNPTDLAVRGRGMLPVALLSEVNAQGSSPQMLLTTTGSFRPDSSGRLVTESGLVLMGWPAAPDGTVPSFPRDTADALEPVRINVNQLSGSPTTKIGLGVNLPATSTRSDAAGTNENLSIEYFDNIGKSESLDIEFIPTIPASGSSNEWTMKISDSASDPALIGEYTLTFDDSRSSGGALLSVADTSGGPYDPTTGEITVDVAGGPMAINIGKIGESNGLTQLSDSFAPLSINKDGSPVGNMVSAEIDENGYVHANFDTGESQIIFQVPLVDLPNPNGMIALDQQTYRPSPESGTYFLWDAGSGPTGSVASYALEESTTDVAGELTDMIKTQRAYSSNAKLIQTVDQMLQETTNIKR